MRRRKNPGAMPADSTLCELPALAGQEAQLAIYKAVKSSNHPGDSPISTLAHHAWHEAEATGENDKTALPKPNYRLLSGLIQGGYYNFFDFFRIIFHFFGRLKRPSVAMGWQDGENPSADARPSAP